MTITRPSELPVDRWMEEQLMEEDVRAVLKMLRPHREERLQGWSEYRTGGTDFRATISWRPGLTEASEDVGLSVPRITDVLEAILVGSARSQAELSTKEEFNVYRCIVRELYQRLDELESRSL